MKAACEKEHDSTVQPLLSFRADINSCRKNGSYRPYTDNGHDSTVQLLLKNRADIK